MANDIRVPKAELAWLGIAAFVAGYDYYAIKTGNETLSRAYWRAVKNPWSRLPAVLVVTGLYKHLLFPNFLPQLDPLNRVAEGWHKKAGRSE